MKTRFRSRRTRRSGFTLVEALLSITIGVAVIGMALSTFLFGLRTMYKDNQRLSSNASLRKFMAQISNETIDASYFYLFRYYTAIDTSVSLSSDTATLTQDFDSSSDIYDRWVAHGDCLVLVTKTSQYRSTDIRQIRIYFRVTTSQAQVNAEAPLRYYETADWGEGTSSTSNGHPLTGLASELNSINLNANPNRTGTRLLNARSIGRKMPSPLTPFVAGDYYPMFSTESATQTSTNGFISINVEFINGTTTNNLLSSSSFNYTISPRR
jgi:hypothetical protein